MTSRQANTLIAALVAVMLIQILCTSAILRGEERSRRQAETATSSAEGSGEPQPNMLWQQNDASFHGADAYAVEQARAEAAEVEAKLEVLRAELRRQSLKAEAERTVGKEPLIKRLIGGPGDHIREIEISGK